MYGYYFYLTQLPDIILVTLTPEMIVYHNEHEQIKRNTGTI